MELLEVLHDDTVISSEGSLSVCAVQCQCMFWKSIRLPCQDVMKFQELRDLLLFCQESIDEH